MEIKNVIFHEIKKQQYTRGENAATKDYANVQLNPKDPIVNNFIEEVLGAYSQQNPVWGNIDETGDFNSKLDIYFNTFLEFTLPKYKQKKYSLFVGDLENNLSKFRDLQKIIDQNLNFIHFSSEVCDLIAKEMSKEHLATGGFVMVLHYTKTGTNWLMVIILKNTEGYGITEALSLEKRKYLNLRNLHESARIDLKKWNENALKEPEFKINCLSFMKAKGKDDQEITEYFRDALGCLGYQNSTKNTTKTINAIKNYMDYKTYNYDKQDTVRQNTASYFKEMHGLDQVVDLDRIARTVNPDDPDDFKKYLQDNNIEIDSAFKPHKKGFEDFEKISFNIHGIKVTFTFADLHNKDIVLSKDGLIIKEVPKFVKEEIVKYTGEPLLEYIKDDESKD